MSYRIRDVKSNSSSSPVKSTIPASPVGEFGTEEVWAALETARASCIWRLKAKSWSWARVLAAMISSRCSSSITETSSSSIAAIRVSNRLRRQVAWLRRKYEAFLERFGFDFGLLLLVFFFFLLNQGYNDCAKKKSEAQAHQNKIYSKKILNIGLKTRVVNTVLT